MNLITILLQAAAEGQRGGGLSMWIMLILIFVVMWVFMIMPQRKQQKEAEAFRKGLKKGDKVVTAGGIYGTIAEVKENERFVVLRVDKDVTSHPSRRILPRPLWSLQYLPNPRKKPKSPRTIKTLKSQRLKSIEKLAPIPAVPLALCKYMADSQSFPGVCRGCERAGRGS